ncbi:MAG: HAD-IA family hydrolase [Rhodobacteraceae bacterium]|nr:HAD-IA family hydrolase [Paracoccaceae bacterium]
MSDPIHVAVFSDMMADRGWQIDEDVYMAHIHGRLNVDIFAEFLPDEPDPQALSEAKEAEFRNRLPRPYPAMPGLPELLDEAQAKGWKLAVVTNAMRPNAEAMLTAIGLRDHFEVLIIGEECERGKPDPLPYRLAMDQLGVTPSQCVIFEDSPSGLRAGRASGAVVVGIRSSLDDETLRANGAHITLKDFTDPALSQVLAQRTGSAA